MKTNIEKLDETRAKITMTITPEEFKPALDEAYKHVARDINIPGFRKGHVPQPIIDQRVGRGYVIEHAINDHLDEFYQQALTENNLKTLGRPTAEVKEVPDAATLAGDLVVEIEVDVRPELKIPDLTKLAVTVDAVEVSADQIAEELDALRARFGTLTTVDRPAKKGDFTSLDLLATVGGVEVDKASNISYEIGSGDLLDGIDEVLDTLTAGETTTFTSKLVGGDYAGQDAEVTVTLTAVKERELPKADDDFAQLASEFDTIKELKESLKGEVAERNKRQQVVQARDKVAELLVEKTGVPVPAHLVQTEVERHLEQEGKPLDDPHGEEVRKDAAKSFQQQIVLDTIGEANEVKVSQDELTGYLIQSAYQYGMEPNEFVKLVTEQNQIAMFVTELGRRKTLDFVLSQATVKDNKGKAVDLSALLMPMDASAVAAEAALREAEQLADEVEKN